MVLIKQYYSINAENPDLLAGGFNLEEVSEGGVASLGTSIERSFK